MYICKFFVEESDSFTLHPPMPSPSSSPTAPISALPSSQSIRTFHRHPSSENVSCANTLYEFDLSPTAVSTPTADDKLKEKLFSLGVQEPSSDKPFELETLTEGKVVGSEGEPLQRVGSVKMDGQLYPTRSGRGDQLEEPVRDSTTKEEVTYISFPEGDPEDPINWPNRKKWMITVCCSYLSLSSSLCSTDIQEDCSFSRLV